MEKRGFHMTKFLVSAYVGTLEADLIKSVGGFRYLKLKQKYSQVQRFYSMHSPYRPFLAMLAPKWHCKECSIVKLDCRLRRYILSKDHNKSYSSSLANDLMHWPPAKTMYYLWAASRYNIIAGGLR